VSAAVCVLGAAAKDFCCYWPKASDLSSCDKCTEKHYDTDGKADCESDKDNTWCPSSEPGPSPVPPSPPSPPSPTPTPTPTGTLNFEPVDGGIGRACRGASNADNSRDYYKVFTGLPSIDDCKAKCVAEPLCNGIEHNPNGRCEVWTRSAGIQASAAVTGYTCLAYGMATCSKEKYSQCGGKAFSGNTCCPVGMWCMRIEACGDSSKWMARCEPCEETWNAACSSSLVQARRKRFRGTRGDLGTAWVQLEASSNKTHLQSLLVQEEL